jgi:hypothetical protein
LDISPNRFDASIFGVPDGLYKHLSLHVDMHLKITTIIYIHVREQHKGHFRELIKAIEQYGHQCRIYCPLNRTRDIIVRMGFKPVNNEFWIR